jgi:PAS domain S-box-containing protein
MGAKRISPPLRELVRNGDAYRFLFSEEELAVFLIGDKVEDCNEAAARMLGRARAAILGRPMLEFCPRTQPDGTTTAVEAVRRIRAALDGLHQWCPWRYERPDGTPVDTLVHIEAISVAGARRILARARDVSRLERAEASLRARELQLKQILDNTTTALVFAKDLEGRYLFVNRAFERLAGRSQREIVGRRAEELFPAAVAAQLRANDRRALEAGRTIELEEQVVRDGETHTLLASKFPLLDADGKAYGVCGFAADITARKRSEDALRRAALAVSGAGGEAVFENLAAQLADILGVGAALISVFSGPDRRHMRTLAALMDGKLLQPFEYDVARSPCARMVGREFRYAREGIGHEFDPDSIFAAKGFDSYAAYTVNAASGDQLGLMVVMDRDPLGERTLIESLLQLFAVRVAAELERARAEEALRASEASYRSIFEASEDAIFVHDWDTGLIRDVSPAAARLYGYAPEELRNLSVETVSANVPPYTATEALQLINQAKAAAAPLRFEWRARHKDGRLLWNDVMLTRAIIAGERRILAFVRDVTERKAAEERLRASEEQHRTIFNASVDGLLLWDPGHRVVDVNEAFGSMLGFTREELIGMTDPLFIPPELQEECRHLLPAIIGGDACRLQARTRRKDGTEVDVEIRGVPMQYQGRPHALMILRDITESKRAENQLRDSERRYRLLFETESDAIHVVDPETLRLIDANPAAEALWGYSRAELMAMDVSELSAEPERTRTSIQVPKGRVHIPLRMHRRKDGSIFPVEITANRLMLDGRLTVVAAVRDITERRQAEEALLASEAQYRSMFNASADALVLRDADFRIVDVNATYERMSGFRRDEVIGAARILANPPDTEATIRALHARALAGEPVLLETTFMRRDGGWLEVELRGVPVQHRGQPHVLWMGRDITPRRQAERERRTLEQQLRQAQKMEAIGHLTGGIAHDFNNILTSIVGYIGLAADRDAVSADAKLEQYLLQARQSCWRARDLIQQMLTFSRGQKGERRPVALNALVKEGLELVRAVIPRSVELDVELADVPVVDADPLQIEQVFLNLCINARDAMADEGRIAVTVRERPDAEESCASCRKAVSGRYVELVVRDNGCGLAPEVLERIFEPFFSTKDVGKGSGMGLAVVHGIVHDHGGHVVVASEPGRGTTFRVLLPVAVDAAVPDEATLPPQVPAKRAALRGRVLLVDDEQSVLEFMRELLETWGMEVVTCGSGRDALEIAVEDGPRPDLVITDQTMPRMTGVQLAAELAKACPGLPVILYTGFAEGVSDAQARVAGVTAVLRKPVEPAALRAAVGTALARGETARQP